MLRRCTRRTTELVAFDVGHVELADDVAEDDRAVAGHHNHRSTRNGSKGIPLSFGPDGEWCADGQV